MCPLFTNTAAVNSTDKKLLYGTIYAQNSETTLILAASEALTISKVGYPLEGYVSETITYVLTVRNTSAAAKTIDLIDTMIISPSGVIIPSHVRSVPAETSATVIPNGILVKWLNSTILGKNEPGNPNALAGYYEKTYTITLITNTNMSGTITNNAVIEFDGTAIQSNQVTTVVKAIVNLSIMKTKLSPADPVYVGDTITYNLAVTNSGPCNATGVYVDDTLPTNAIIIPDPHWILVSGTTYRYKIGNLEAGATKNITLQVIPLAPTN